MNTLYEVANVICECREISTWSNTRYNEKDFGASIEFNYDASDSNTLMLLFRGDDGLIRKNIYKPGSKYLVIIHEIQEYIQEEHTCNKQ